MPGTDAYLRTVFKCYVKWDGTNWTDESAYFISASINANVADPRKGVAANGAGLYQTCSVQMANDSGRYSPENAAGAEYAYISANKGMGIPLRLVAYYYGETNYTVFQGYIDSIEIQAPTDPVATFSCVGGEYPLLEHKTTRTTDASTLQKDIFISDWIEILAAEGNITDTAIDDGYFRVPWVWMSDGDSLWGELQAAAAAEAGYVYVSAAGQLRFENLYHWLTDSTHATSRGILRESDYTGISRSYAQTETFNAVACPYKPRGAGARAKLFSLSEYWTVIAGGEKTFYIELKQPAIVIEQPIANEQYVAVTSGDIDVSSLLTITLTKRPQQVEVKVVNGSNQNATFRKFELWGTPLVGGKTSQIVAQVDSAIGNAATSTDLLKLRTMEQNDLIQSRQQAELLASVEADRVGVVTGAIKINGCPARPQWELGDRITVICSTEMIWFLDAGYNLDAGLTFYDAYSRDVFITGYTLKCGPGPAFEQDFEVIEAAAMYPYTAAEYFILGTDVPGNTKRLFY